MKSLFKSLKWLLLISGILVMVFGIVMLFTPLEGVTAIALYIGIAMLLSGVTELITYFAQRAWQKDYWFFASGLLSLLFGIWVVVGRGSEVLVSLIPFVFAVWVIASGVARIAGSLSLRFHYYAFWLPSLLVGIASVVAGFILMFSPLLASATITLLIALMLLFYGVNSIFLALRLQQIGDAWERTINR